MANQITINIGAAANDGTGDPLRTAFNDVNLNFANVWNTGLPNSNVQFSDNRILTVNTNANLILAPNGIGKVASNVDIIPNTSNVFGLGSTTRRWNTVYTQYLDVSSAITGTLGNVTVAVANLHITGGTNGYVLQTDGAGNLTWTAQTGGGGNGVPGGANTQVQYNNAGSFGGSAGFTFDRTSNVLAVSGNITAGNISVTSVTTSGTIYGNSATFYGDQYSDGALYVGTPAGTVLGSDVVIQITANAGGYSQTNFQNISNAITASGDYIITADNGNDTTKFIDLGMTSSGWDGSETNVLSGLVANNGYLYVQDGNLSLGVRNGNTSYKWNFDTTGLLTVPGNVIPTGNNTQSLGSATRQWKDLWVSNNTIYINSVPISLTAGNILTVDGNDVVTTNANGTVDLANLAIDNNNIYNTQGQGVIISNFNFVTAEAETAYVQIPAGNSTNDLNVVQEQGNVRLVANTAVWNFGTDGILTTPGLKLNNFIIELNPDSAATQVEISPNGESWAFLQIPNNATGNVANVRLHNDAGNIEIAAGDTTHGGSTHYWYFDNTGNLIMPNGGYINFVNTGGITQALNEDLRFTVSDDEEDGWAVQSTVNDGAGNDLTRMQVRYDGVQINTDLPTNNYNWTFRDSGEFDVPGPIRGPYGGNLVISIGDQFGAGPTFIDLQTRSYVGDALISNIRIGDPNVTVSTASGAYNWAFDGTGNLTVPGAILGTSTIALDNRDTGNTADIQLYSADDILVQGRNKPDDSEAEGGDINIYAGDGANAVTEGVDAGGGGDIQIYGGLGGSDTGGGFGGSAGGTITISSGDGGAGDTTTNAGGGGSLSITAGSAAGVANTALGGLGGTISITAGDTTRINEIGGSISLNTGAASGDGTSPAGYLEINIPSSNVGAGGTWTFSGTGRELNVPADSSIYGANFGNLTVGCAGNTFITSSNYGSNVKNWTFGYTGTLSLPGMSTGTGTGESAAAQGSRKIIGITGGDPDAGNYGYAASSAGHTAFGNVAWTASSSQVQSAKITFVVQTGGVAFNWEQFDVAVCKFDSANAVVSVSNRIRQNSAIAYTEVSGYVNANVLEIWLNPADGQTEAFINYDAVEFNIMVD